MNKLLLFLLPLDQKRPEPGCDASEASITCMNAAVFTTRKTKKTGAYLGMITRDKGLVPPRRRQIVIDSEKLDNDSGSGKISVPEPRLGQVNEYGLSLFSIL